MGLPQPRPHPPPVCVWVVINFEKVGEVGGGNQVSSAVEGMVDDTGIAQESELAPDADVPEAAGGMHANKADVATITGDLLVSMTGFAEELLDVIMAAEQLITRLRMRLSDDFSEMIAMEVDTPPRQLRQELKHNKQVLVDVAAYILNSALIANLTPEVIDGTESGASTSYKGILIKFAKYHRIAKAGGFSNVLFSSTIADASLVARFGHERNNFATNFADAKFQEHSSGFCQRATDIIMNAFPQSNLIPMHMKVIDSKARGSSAHQ